jgi:hypothetical protein
LATIPYTRRTLLQGAAAAGATAALAAPFVHGAFAAGKLTVGFWDHWVPGANDTLTKLCNEWAAKEKGDQDRLHHLAGRQAQPDAGGRSEGALRPRHADVPGLGGGGAER